MVFRACRHQCSIGLRNRNAGPEQPGNLKEEVLIDDPGAYTKPWDVAWNIPWNPNGEITEYICQQNNRFMRKLKDDLGQPVFFGKSGKE